MPVMVFENHELLLPGDLIFVSARRSAISYVVKGWQVLLDPLAPIDFIPTHVAIATGDGFMVFHSTTHRLKYGSLADFIDTDKYSAKILVFRNKDLETQLGTNFHHATIRAYFKSQWDMKYNYLGAVFGTRIKSMKYCSELAVDFFHHLEITGIDLKASRTLPRKLLNLCRHSDKFRTVIPLCEMIWNEDAYIKWNEARKQGETPAVQQLMDDELAMIFSTARTQLIIDHNNGELTNKVATNNKIADRLLNSFKRRRRKK